MCPDCYVVTDAPNVFRSIKCLLKEQLQVQDTQQLDLNLIDDSPDMFENFELPSIIVVDLTPGQHLPAAKHLLRHLMTETGSSLTLIVVSDGHLPVEVAGEVDLLATAYIDLPFEFVRARKSISHLTPATAASGARQIPPHRLVSAGGVSLRTFAPELFWAIDQIERVASQVFTLLIVGETGTGKTTLARLIHEMSPRRDRAFHSVACGALPRELIESELFGHARGAFTGADRNRMGRIDAAGEGTLLLDEIDILEMKEQAKLLQVIESGKYEAVGSTETRVSRARVIVASNVDLQKLVKEDRFRADLYYRLNILQIQLPSLKDRALDIVPLALDFVMQLGQEHQVEIKTVHRHFLTVLREYSWPGNLRELHNHMRRAVLFAENGRLTVNELTPDILDFGSPADGPAAPQSPVLIDPEATQLSEITANFPSETATDSETEEECVSLADQVAANERQILTETLSVHNDNRTASAKALGISRVGLYKKMRRHGMIGDDDKNSAAGSRQSVVVPSSSK